MKTIRARKRRGIIERWNPSPVKVGIFISAISVDDVSFAQ